MPVACNKAMRLLAGGSLSREEVSAKTRLSAGAVDAIQAAMSRRGAAAAAAAAAETGWESLPDATRFSLTKSEYCPTPTRDAWIMARLLAEGATGPSSAVRMPEDRSVRELVGYGHVRRAGGGIYLAGLGLELAEEVLSAYPEIGRPSFSRYGGAGRRACELVGEVAPVAPPRAGPGRRQRQRRRRGRGAHAQ